MKIITLIITLATISSISAQAADTSFQLPEHVGCAYSVTGHEVEVLVKDDSIADVCFPEPLNTFVVRKGLEVDVSSSEKLPGVIFLSASERTVYDSVRSSNLIAYGKSGKRYELKITVQRTVPNPPPLMIPGQPAPLSMK